MTINLPGFRSHGIREPLTNRIAGILDEYPDGTQIARELLQNSDDARSTVQWYLIDHHSYADNIDGSDDLKIFHNDLKEYMGPALLAGNDSLFEERDYKSMKNLAASEKRNDETKIGQMGIGIYHMTDCPSFISGDQFMVIEPHERIFNGINSSFVEGAVRGSFTEGRAGLEVFPDQLRTFSVLEEIDYAKPYQGTIFRFPLRTDRQALTSKLSKNAYPAEKVLDMLLKLKNEALKAMLFLKHIEKIAIYERKNLEDGPKLLFEIKIENAEEVREERQGLLAKLKAHVNPEQNASRDAILEYSVRPIFKLIEEDGTTETQHWHISTLVGNVLRSREFMTDETDGNLDAHKLIPWVGIAAPSEPGVDVGSSGLFCFLPISIQLPFPVHINGHFAVKQSRREIWTNQDNDFARHASAYIKSVWNVHLFHTHVPVVYAKFLADLGLARGANYGLWPVSCGAGIGLDAIWNKLLYSLLQVVCRDNLKVFFCKSKDKDQRAVDYKTSWIAGRDIDGYPLLLNALQELVNVVAGLPDAVLETIPAVLGSLELESRILTPSLVRQLLREYKYQWSSSASPETRVEMLQYCILDNEIKDLEGLPLLPLAGDIWVEFSISAAYESGLIDIEIDKNLVRRFNNMDMFHVFWSNINCSVISSKVRDTYNKLLYQSCPKTENRIPQPTDGFPTTQWISDFWTMVRSLPDQNDLLFMLEGLHLLPLTHQRLAPLSRNLPVVYLRSDDDGRSSVPFLKILDDQLNCRVMREDTGDWRDVATAYVFELRNSLKVLDILSEIPAEDLINLDQDHCEVVSKQMGHWLHKNARLNIKQLQTLKTMPIYQTYDHSAFVSLQYPEHERSKWKLARHFHHSENPWLPMSINLLTDGQHMHTILTELIRIRIILESEYWYEILRNLEKYSQGKWDSIVEKFCGKYHVHRKDHDFPSLLKDIAFVRASGPNSGEFDVQPASQLRLSPQEIVSPSFSSLFVNSEIVFPSGIYAEPAILNVLTEIGIRSTFNADFVLDRVEKLSRHAQAKCSKSIKDTLLAFYTRLNADFSSKFKSVGVQNILHQRSWILAIASPEDDLQCYSPSECRPESDLLLVGSQMPVSHFQFTNKSLIECIGWNQLPPLDVVLKNFLSVIKRANPENGTYGSRPDEVTFIKIYHYLMEHVKDDGALSTMKSTLNSQPWILVNGALHTIDRVALYMSYDLAPHFVQIKSPGLEELFLAMGVREEVKQADLQGIISGIASRNGKYAPLSATDTELVIKLLNWISIGDKYWSTDLLVLTRDNQLRAISDVVYDDVSERDNVSPVEDGDKGYVFASNRIKKFVAEGLQMHMYSAKSWDDQIDSTFEPWAQEENIVVRIRNVLNDYDPSSIFLEFLQNAADAGATKCSFILDQRTFNRKKVLSDEMKAWQGPALIIYNDAEFSQSDFNALCKLGEGNKSGDPSKIGRHGLGFNSVYHFTDVPSVVSGSYIGFYDPLREYLPKTRTQSGLVGRGGQRCHIRNLRGDAISDQLEPYKGLFECDMKSHYHGTIFRIPLRTPGTQMRASGKSIINNYWTLSEMHDMLKKWVDDAKIGALFLDKIVEIEIATLSNDADAPKFSCVAKKTFGAETQSLNKALYEKNGTTSVKRIADIRISSTSVALCESQQWLIHTDFEHTTEVSQLLKDFELAHHWYPHRGIAIPIGPKFKHKDFTGRLFTHLPTPILTGLPFHIHGAFALTSNRKSLAGGTDKTSPQRMWNDYMMLDCLPLTAMAAMERLLKIQFWSLNRGPPKSNEIHSATEQYFKYWPIKARPEFDLFVQRFSRSSYIHPVYPVNALNKTVHVQFICGSDVVFPELRYATRRMEIVIRGHEQKRGVNISECPIAIQARLRLDWNVQPVLNFSAIDEDSVRRIIRNNPEFIATKCKSIEDMRWILEYTLKAVLDPKKPIEVPIPGLHLLPLMNKSWKPLAPSSACYTAKAEMRELINGGEYLIDESMFKGSAVSSSQAGEHITVPKLELIYRRLAGDTTYGVTHLPPAKFVSIFNSENPGGASDEQREKLWRLLGNTSDLEPYGDLPILLTLSKQMIPLRLCRSGIELSRLAPLMKRNVERLSGLMEDLNIIVFDVGQNKKHPYLTEVAPGINDNMILSCISRRCSDLPENRIITKQEAEVLREMIKADTSLSNQEAALLGKLRIWNTWSASGRSQVLGLVAAKNSYFIEGNFSLNHLGDNSDVIESDYCKNFTAMGARPLNVVSAAEQRVIPRLLNKTLNYNNHQTRAAYHRMVTDIIKVASTKKGGGPAREFLLNKQFLRAQDDNFRICRELFSLDDMDLAAIFSGEVAKFPDIVMWQAIGGSQKQNLLGVRTMNDPSVVRECALHVLHLTSCDPDGLDPSIHMKATALVRYIYRNYQNCGDIDWMKPEWRIVPAEATQSSPFNKKVPDMPAYMSFSELVDSSHRDICWTRCAFFPENLKPSDSFKARFPSVGKPKLEAVIRHLSTLASDLAPVWTDMDDQPILKMSLFKVYRFLNEVYEKEAGNAAVLQNQLSSLRVPYILNGDDKDPSVKESWLWPSQLMLDIDNDIERHQVVSSKLKAVRGFLVASGVEQMKAVEGRVDVPEGRRKGDIEDRLLNCFETQDRHNGFMDIVFLFAGGQQIMAHKFMLVHANDYFASRFTGVWAEYTTRNPSNLGEEVIDLSDMDGDETFEAFWGLLYYFYTDKLIFTNGPPIPEIPTTAPAHIDILRDRVQYLMGLLCLADQYQSPRLKALIAAEVVEGQKVLHTNVFNVRKFAMLYNSIELKEHCEKYVKTNSSIVSTYLQGEVQNFTQELKKLGKGHGAKKAELREEVRELEESLIDLSVLV
ncbi:hypothetical protein BGX27_000604 [Mortierella sp. AM989]|nr:hypothetical protein BGX27_000604 [Mortierella sp. AM989]